MRAVDCIRRCPQLTDQLHPSRWYPSLEYLALLVIKTFGHWGFKTPNGGTILQSQEFINFKQFIYTVVNRTSMPFNAITLAMLYLQRLKKYHPQCRSAAVGSSARLLLAAVVISNKYLQDDCYDNKTWSNVSGFAVAEVNKMEQELLHFCSYNMHVQREEFQGFQQKLHAAMMTVMNRAGCWCVECANLCCLLFFDYSLLDYEDREICPLQRLSVGAFLSLSLLLFFIGAAEENMGLMVCPQGEGGECMLDVPSPPRSMQR